MLQMCYKCVITQIPSNKHVTSLEGFTSNYCSFIPIVDLKVVMGQKKTKKKSIEPRCKFNKNSAQICRMTQFTNQLQVFS